MISSQKDFAGKLSYRDGKSETQIERLLGYHLSLRGGRKAKVSRANKGGTRIKALELPVSLVV